jgi:hypothetical protein
MLFVLLLLFDMRLLVISITAVCGPQMIKADEPRSIIYAVIFHEVYFALSLAYCLGEAGCPISTSGTFWPVTSAGKPSCDGSTSEFRIVDLITQHDVSADEKLSGSSHFGLGTAATLCQSFVETL